MAIKIMEKLQRRTQNEEETRIIGKCVGSCLSPGQMVALIGDLGAGKTCFTKGLAKGLGVPEEYEITSPTFTLINEYPGRIPLCHVDAYRLEGSRDMADTGFEDFFHGYAVVVIEWAERIRDILPEDTLFISFDYVDDTTRILTFSGEEALIQSLGEKITPVDLPADTD
jgi:tRNA threonylcarbamoyladenosine biosynthesis protein TsaE